MKQIIETKMVEQTTTKWVADDGMEFTGEGAEYKCKMHEAMKTDAIIKANFDKVMHKAIDLPLVDWCGEAEGWLVRLTNEEDYFYTTVFFKSRIGAYGDMDITEPTSYPCTKLIVESDCDVYEYINPLSKLLERYADTVDAINNFGF